MQKNPIIVRYLSILARIEVRMAELEIAAWEPKARFYAARDHGWALSWGAVLDKNARWTGKPPPSPGRDLYEELRLASYDYSPHLNAIRDLKAIRKQFSRMLRIAEKQEKSSKKPILLDPLDMPQCPDLASIKPYRSRGHIAAIPNDPDDD